MYQHFCDSKRTNGNMSLTAESIDCIDFGNAPLSPSGVKFPNHLPSPVDDELEAIAGTIFQRCAHEVQNDAGAPYDMAHYPIEEKQHREHLERHMTTK